MRVEDQHRIRAVGAALERSLSGWRVLEGPSPYGWAPSRHLRATIAGNAQTVKVVIRQSSTDRGHALEMALYRRLLSRLPLRSPLLIGEFSLGDGAPGWMVLEDLGDVQVDPSSAHDRAALLLTLGKLHGAGRVLLTQGGLDDVPLPRFAADTSSAANWHAVLEAAASQNAFGVSGWVVAAFEELLPRMSGSVQTIVHGDMDLSNALIAEGRSVALVDWEKASIGPPGVDLGPLADTLASYDEVESYRAGFGEAQGASPHTEEVRHWLCDGEMHTCIRWICYFIDAAFKGNPPPEEWRQRYYEPCLSRLRAMCGA